MLIPHHIIQEAQRLHGHAICSECGQGCGIKIQDDSYDDLFGTVEDVYLISDCCESEVEDGH